MDSGFEGLVKRLKTLASSVTAVLDEAEQRQIRNDPRVEAWLDKAQEAVFEAEGLLDEIEYDALRLKVTGDSGVGTSEVRESKRPRNMFSFIRRSNNVEEVTEERKLLERFEKCSRLEEFAIQKEFLDLIEDPAEERRWQKPPSTCLLEESQVFGRDTDMEALLKSLLSDDISGNENISVIPIVGMGGVGKTTLAQAAFNHPRVKEHFDLKFWVWVSEKFDVCKVISALLCSTASSLTHDADDLHSLQIELRDKLAGKKFLVVLDDVWTDKHTDWELMRNSFIDMLHGSRIIVTTRNHEVARIILRREFSTECSVWSLRSSVDTLRSDDQTYKRDTSNKSGFSTECSIGATDESVGSLRSSVDTLRSDDQTYNRDTSNKRCTYKRKVLPMWTEQVRVNSETNIRGIEDGFSWRKYGQKDVLRAQYPRSYFRCSFKYEQSCLATKQMQKLDEDPTLFNVTYIGKHTCSQAGSSVQLQDQRPNNKTTTVQHSLESDLRVMGTSTIYLNVLDEGASWQLFLKHAFGDNVNTNSDFERIGRKIVKKCKGLPLALKTFGGLVRHKLDIDHWEGIMETEVWELTDKQSDILMSLRLSYQHLPRHLKRCFAYCAIFAKDYHFEKEELISLWMAQNLLEQPQDNRTLEEVGEQYFDDLVSISLIQPSSEVSPQFVMHDLIVDLATVVSGKYCHRLDGRRSINELTKEMTRHLACSRIDDIAYERLNSILNPTQLRTFLDQNSQIQSPFSVSKTKLLDFFINLKHLKALSFAGYHESRGPIDSICELKHLRFLKLSNMSIGRVPNSLCTLYNLQTLKFVNCGSLNQLPEDIHHLINLRYLDASYTAIEELPESLSRLSNLQKMNLQGCVNLNNLPKDFRHLINLRFLDASRTCLEELPESLSQLSQFQHLDLFCCSKLEKLPENFHHLINLRYLNVEGSNLKEMPVQLCELKSLRTLSTYVVGKGRGANIRELGNLPNLRGRLCIKNLQNLENPEDVLYVKLWEKSHLDELEFVWTPRQTNEYSRELGVLQNLKPHTSLVKLKISGYGDRKFPYWLGHHSYSNIVHVHLSGCNNCATLPRLGELPYLKTLQIGRFDAVVNVGPEFCGMSSSMVTKAFPSLEELSFYEMRNWEEWSMLDGDDIAFPKLLKLALYKCCGLKRELHRFFSTLSELVISRCEELSLSSLEMLETAAQIYRSQLCLPPTALQMLSISSYNCTSLFVTRKSVPNLKSLTIGSCRELKFLPENMHELLPALEILDISDCSELESFPTSGLPVSLCSLTITNCDKLVASRRYWKLQKLNNLKNFMIWGYGGEDMESFPEQGLLPSTVTQLEISDVEFLKSLNTIELQQLTSLRRLLICYCSNLHTMTGQEIPESLEDLTIAGCPFLKEKCETETGEYWNSIAHIPNIVLC